MALNFHENLTRTIEMRGSSDRNFGFVIASFLAFLSLWPLRAGGQVRIPILAVAGVFLVTAFVRPALLQPLNAVWTKLGLLLSRILNPVVTAVLFFFVFTPAGLLSRLLARDPLRLKAVPGANTYWITRSSRGSEPETMSKQF